jgi:glycosyltransferase involved in cell wall biosynthesis
VTVIHRGRDKQLLGTASPDRKARVRASLGVDADAPVVITVGRQEYQKGHRHLLEAVPALADRFPNVEVLIVGREGHTSSELQTLTASLEIGDRVRFMGHRTDVADLLAAADVFVFPSVYEGLGGASLEAMALSLPIVASDIPALHEVVEADTNGILVPPGDAFALQTAISRLLADPDLREQFGSNSRMIFERDFDATESIPRTVDLMNRIAAQAKSTSA